MNSELTFTCPVCAFGSMEEPPENHAICACCGTEFGYDDVSRTHRELRDRWLERGGDWFDPADSAYPGREGGWSAWAQLDRAGLAYDVERPSVLAR